MSSRARRLWSSSPQLVGHRMFNGSVTPPPAPPHRYWGPCRGYGLFDLRLGELAELSHGGYAARMLTHSLWLVLVCLALAACSDNRPVSGSQDGQPPSVDAISAVDSSRDSARSPDLGADPQCVIAYRHPTDSQCCCGEHFPALAQEVAADPCLVETGGELWTMPEPEAACGGACLPCDCISNPPPSRAVAWTGERCEFVGECESDADCILATNTRVCCACPEVYPAQLVDTDACLVAGSLRGDPNPPVSCAEDCDWQCPMAGDCQGPPTPDCDITARLPMGEMICRGIP